jgi:c-di-GMP-binding flagellar brake protein YcgR
VKHVLPDLNSLVRVCIGEGDGEGYASRVENRDGRLLTVAAPSFAGDLFATREGMQVVVRWTGGRGVFEVDGLLETVDHDESVLVWTIRTTGDVRLAQRRRYARVAFTEPLAVHCVEDAAGAEATGSWSGVGVDLGEGGIRLRLPAGVVQVGEQVTVELRLDDEPMTLPGMVLRARPTGEADVATSGRPTPVDDVVVEFSEPVPGEDVIRRWVLRQQVLARRRERAPW